MRYLGILFVLICSCAAYGQNSLKLQKEGTKRSHDLILGDRLRVKKNNEEKISGYLWGWTDTTIIFDFDTILVSEISSLFYTPKLRKITSVGIEITGVVSSLTAIGLIGVKLYSEMFFFAYPAFVYLPFLLPVLFAPFFTISQLVKYKRKYVINQKRWRLVATN